MNRTELTHIKGLVYCFILFVLIFCNSFTYAQSDFFVEDLEDDIKSQFELLFQNNQIKFTQPDSTKIALSQYISELLEERLTDDSVFRYPFDSIPYWGVRYSQDHKIKIYNWNIKLSTGKYIYYGFIQYLYDGNYYYYRLKDVFTNDEKLPFEILRDGDWVGGNYYKIIDCEYKKEPYYLILGNRHNYYTSKYKIIDVLYFVGKRMRLGRAVFKDHETNIPRFSRRLFFEYSHYVNMALYYDKEKKMCIFDDLMPESPDLEKQKRFYTPSGTYNGLQLIGGKWFFKTNVKVENPFYKPKSGLFNLKKKNNKYLEYNLYQPNKKLK